MSRNLPKYLVAFVASMAIVSALLRLVASDDDLVVSTTRIGEIPVTTLQRADTARAPAIVIAHGFAGSQQLMQPLATTLARSGYLAVSFDFPGHGRNTEPLDAGLADLARMQRHLFATLESVIRHARGLGASDGRIGLVGHSMAAEIVTRHADRNPDIEATVALSLFLPKPQVLNPRNLLMIDGALEAGMLREQGIAMISAAIGRNAEPSVTYGDFSTGNARRVVFARGVEHVGVLYAGDSLRETRDWMNKALTHGSEAALDRRGPWLGLLFGGLFALAWPLSGLVPRLGAEFSQPARDWRRLLVPAFVPAVLTPLLLGWAPARAMPILLADYLVLHFAVYGMLTLAVMAMMGRSRATHGNAPFPLARFVAVAMAVTAYSIVVLGGLVDTWFNAFFPPGARAPWIVVMSAGTLLYFLADEWLTRRHAPMRFAYALTKLCFIVSLLIAIALNLDELFFLAIIVPAIVLLLCLYGLFSRWLLASSREPMLAGVSNALVFAWFIVVTFPMVDR